MLDDLVKKLIATDGEKFAFGSEDLYWLKEDKPIFLPREAKFLDEGPDRFSPKRILHYDPIMPFNNENHDDTDWNPNVSGKWFFLLVIINWNDI